MKKTLLVFVLDESGSMQNIASTTMDGFNEYVDSLKPHGNAVSISLVTFNSMGINHIFTDNPIQSVPKLSTFNYHPNALTPLYDAVGRAIKDTETILVKRTDKPQVLFVIMTDGLENDSKEYNRQKVFDLINSKPKDTWQFVFLGANQDSWDEGEKIGMQVGNTRNYVTDSHGVARGFGATIVASACYLTSAAPGSGFYNSVKEADVDVYEAKILSRGGDTSDRTTEGPISGMGGGPKKGRKGFTRR